MDCPAGLSLNEARGRQVYAKEGPPMALSSERCVACRADSPLATEGEVAELHPQVPEWELTERDGIPRLERAFPFRNFAQALAFAVKVGEAAEAEGHHPRLTVDWGRVVVTWWTHKVKGLHRNDFVMASKTDMIHRQVLPVNRRPPGDESAGRRS